MIEPTKEWMEEISVALATCDEWSVLLTPDFAESAYCDQELGFALSRDVLIIPIRHGADPHGFISKFQALPGDTSQLASHHLAKGIFEVLVASHKTAAKLAPAIAERYSGAHSYDDARANLGRLLEIPADHWTTEMIELVEKAGRENSQLRHGIYYGEKIPAVVSRHLDEQLGNDKHPGSLQLRGNQVGCLPLRRRATFRSELDPSGGRDRAEVACGAAQRAAAGDPARLPERACAQDGSQRRRPRFRSVASRGVFRLDRRWPGKARMGSSEQVRAGGGGA